MTYLSINTIEREMVLAGYNTKCASDDDWEAMEEDLHELERSAIEDDFSNNKGVWLLELAARYRIERLKQ